MSRPKSIDATSNYFANRRQNPQNAPAAKKKGKLSSKLPERPRTERGRLQVFGLLRGLGDLSRNVNVVRILRKMKQHDSASVHRNRVRPPERQEGMDARESLTPIGPTATALTANTALCARRATGVGFKAATL